MYFHYRNEKYIEHSDRKIAYLHEFLPNLHKISELKHLIDEIYALSKENILKTSQEDPEMIIEDDFYAKND
jgi:hypothetical protein